MAVAPDGEIVHRYDKINAESRWACPKELWCARALENGFYLAGCNRTGIDRIMDCRQAPSLVCDPSGKVIHEAATESSRKKGTSNDGSLRKGTSVGKKWQPDLAKSAATHWTLIEHVSNDFRIASISMCCCVNEI